MTINTVPKTMRAARLHDRVGKFQLDEIPVPAARATDVLVKVVAAGVVPNLRNVIRHYPGLPKFPAVMGLDSAGVVVAVGEQVRTGVKIGDRVYVNPGLSCGACSACRRGEQSSCPAYAFMGYFGFGQDSQNQYDAYPYGGFGEYLTAPAANAIRLPENVSFEQASRFGYLGTALAALRKVDLRPGQKVLINGGTGTLGVGAVLLALAMGAGQVFASGRDRGRLEKLKRLAPDRIVTLDAGTGTVATEVMKATGGEGVDGMVEALAPGSAASSLVDAFGALRRGGIAVNVGGVTEPLPLDPLKLMLLQKTLRGSLWFSNAEGQELAAMAEAGTLNLKPFEHEVFSLDQVNDALDAIDARSGGFTNIVIRHG